MKQLQFEAQTIFDIGNAINPNCLKIMPLEPKKKLQKFAVGTLSSLQYWECKKGEFVQDSKTENQQKEISRVVISGNAAKFSLFYAAGQSIRGVTKKGKEFFKLDTSHTEAIKSLHVISTHLWSAGDYILNCYESVDSKIIDKYFFICEDKINDMIIAPVAGQMVLNPVLACQDKTLRVLQDDRILYQHRFESACTAISLAEEQTHRHCPVIGYGLRNGGVGCIELTRDEPVIIWSLDGTQTNGSAVAVVKTFNFHGESYHSMIIARDDGSIEIYSYEHQSPIPLLRFETKVSESITGIDVGYITNPNKQDIIATTYSGKIISLLEKATSKIRQPKVPQQQIADNKNKAELESQIEKDIQQLQAQLNAANEQLAAKNKSKKKDVAETQQQQQKVEFEQYKVSYKMNLVPNEAAQVIFIDSQLPIDCLMIQSMQNIDIIEVKDNICRINKIQGETQQLLATLKVQGEDSQVSRVEIKIRTPEGQLGNLSVMVIPKGCSTCQALEIELKPLSLHERINKIDQEMLESLPLSRLTLKGKFSLSESHLWITACLPDVPQNVSQENESEVKHTLYYKSTLIGTYIVIELCQGEISILSDNLSVIAIIKDQVTSFANQKKQSLEIDSSILDSSWQLNLQLLNPLIQEQYLIAQQLQLIDALKELQLDSNNGAGGADADFMSDEYKDILRNSEKIRAQFKQQPRKLTYLWGIIADLYTDTAKIKGRHNVQSKMGMLKQILNNYNYDSLVQFFNQSW